MKIYYLRSEYNLNDNAFEDAAAQSSNKEGVRISDVWGRCKFSVFVVDEQEVLLVFCLDTRHVDVAKAYIELKNIDRSAFQCAGLIFSDRVEFDSDSCALEFGYDKPSEEGVDAKIMEALRQDGFFK